MSRPPTESTSRVSTKRTDKAAVKAARKRRDNHTEPRRSTVAARRSVRSGAGSGAPLGDLTRPIARDRRLLRGRSSRWLVPATAIGLVMVFGFALFVRPVQTYFDQNRKLEERTVQYNQILTVIGQLRAEVERLKTPDGIKEAAREQVGYINAGEERVTINVDGKVPTELPPGWPYGMATAIIATRSQPQPGVLTQPAPAASVPQGSTPGNQPVIAPTPTTPPATAVTTP